MIGGSKMALYLCLNQDGTGVVSEQNPIQTKHTTAGEPIERPVYLFNDGKRKGVENDTNPPKLVYTNLRIAIEGVSNELANPLGNSKSDIYVTFNNVVEGWNIGTVLRVGSEKMRVDTIKTDRAIEVTRGYENSPVLEHTAGTLVISDTSSISLALPQVGNYENPGTFLAGGQAITSGVDPSLLTREITAEESSNVVVSEISGLYALNSYIQIGKEVMKVIAVDGRNYTVLRGQNDTKRQHHNTGAVIHCVGIVDVHPITHKFFLRNDPPQGLPTQKKRDVKIVLIADEEPS